MEKVNPPAKEVYISPETEMIRLSLERTILSDTGEPIGGGGDPDIPIPDHN